MPYRHTGAIWELELPALTQHVLHALAWHACEICGLAWPSVPTLAKRANLGATTVRDALERLRKADLIRVHAYPQGGRARSTQYVVLPGLPGLSTAPCAKCVWNLANPSPRGGYDKGRTEKPTATRGVSAKPTATDPETHRRAEPGPIAEAVDTVMDRAKSHRPGGG